MSTATWTGAGVLGADGAPSRSGVAAGAGSLLGYNGELDREPVSSSDSAIDAVLSGGGVRAGDAAGDSGKGSRAQFKIVLLVVAEHEEAIIEADWLAWLDQTCEDIELHINVKEVRSKRRAAIFPRLTTGRLTGTRLQNLLPPANLLTVSLCGTPNFARDVRELYLSMGLPRTLLSTVG